MSEHIRNVARLELTTTDMSVYYSAKEYYSLTPDAEDKLTQMLVDRPLTVSEGSTIYVTKKCKIPRVKLRKYLEKTKSRIVRDVTKASHIFVPNKLKDTVSLSGIYGSYFNEKTIKRLLDYIKSGGISDKNSEKYKSFITWLMGYHETHETFSISFPHYYYNSRPDPEDLFKTIRTTRENYQVYVIKDEDRPVVQYLLDNKDKVYIEGSILKEINDSVVIDESIYNRLNTYLASSDTQNTTLAMEIISNSVYEKSLPYLLKLFNNHGRKMYESEYYGNVGFQSLVRYLDMSSKDIQYMDVDDMVKILYKKGALNEETERIIHRDAIEEIESRNRLRYYRITDVQLDISTLKENLD